MPIGSSRPSGGTWGIPKSENILQLWSCSRSLATFFIRIAVICIVIIRFSPASHLRLLQLIEPINSIHFLFVLFQAKCNCHRNRSNNCTCNQETTPPLDAWATGRLLGSSQSAVSISLPTKRAITAFSINTCCIVVAVSYSTKSTCELAPISTISKLTYTCGGAIFLFSTSAVVVVVYAPKTKVGRFTAIMARQITKLPTTYNITQSMICVSQNVSTSRTRACITWLIEMCKHTT